MDDRQNWQLQSPMLSVAFKTVQNGGKYLTNETDEGDMFVV